LAKQQGEAMKPSFSDALKVWLRIGVFSFGGPAGQIALIHREVLDERKWIEEREFLNALNFCMLLPGPEAMQLATYIGWKLHGVKGGLAAGLLFVLPGALVILALSMLYAVLGKLNAVEGLFWGIKAAVLVIVLEALLRVAKKALKGNLDWAIAVFSFLALFFFGLPFPLVIAVAAAIGIAFPNNNMAQAPAASHFPFWHSTVKTILIWLAIWLVPLGFIFELYGSSHIYFGLARFFSQLAVVTFGGAYAVLAYMGQDVVELHNWLTAHEMIDGLGLAETTPGPLILVGQFVGFTAAAKAQGSLWAGVIGSVIFLWMTFVPCFLWIFAGAPYVVHLQNMPRVSSALSRITAAVVGVILNLALWFALHVLFSSAARLSGPIPVWWPNLASFDVAAFTLSIIAAIALLHYKIGIPKTLAIAASLGVIYKLIIPLI
jgi:chromate transporter